MPKPTWNETRMARRLMRRRVPMEKIVVVFANKFTAVEITDAVIAQRARENTQAKQDGRSESGRVIAKIARAHPGVSIPDAVICDRARRLSLVPSSTTALLCGDPLPGCSALERAPSLAPAANRDPLDALIFRDRVRAQA